MAREPKSRKQAPAGLSRERILAAARATAEEDGVEALSMRRLAQRLDVWPMSIYTYFRDKDELLDALADSAAARARLPGAGVGEAAAWRDEMRALLHEARRVLGADHGALASRLPRALLSPGMLRITDAGLAVLARAGFEASAAASAWRALLGYTFGFAATSLDGDGARGTHAAIAALPEGQLPALARAAAEVAAALSADGEFDRGLDALLDGLERRRSGP